MNKETTKNNSIHYYIIWYNIPWKKDMTEIKDAYLAAWMPSHVDANFIKIRSFLIPCSANILISLIAFAILASLSNDNLK